MRKSYPGPTGEFFAWRLRVEKVVIPAFLGGVWALVAYQYGVWCAVKVNLGGLFFSGLFDTLRFILEHADQDNSNPFSQATL